MSIPDEIAQTNGYSGGSPSPSSRLASSLSLTLHPKALTLLARSTESKTSKRLIWLALFQSGNLLGQGHIHLLTCQHSSLQPLRVSVTRHRTDVETQRSSCYTRSCLQGIDVPLQPQIADSSFPGIGLPLSVQQL